MKKLMNFWAAVLFINLILPVSANMAIFERSYKDGVLAGQRLALVTTEWDTITRISRRSELQVVYTCSRLASGLEEDPLPYRNLLRVVYHRQDNAITKLDRRDDFYFAIGAAQSHMINGAAMHSAIEGIPLPEAMKQMSAKIYDNLCLPLLITS
ncbi:MAG: hypothetical protein HRU05_19180 [Oceanospirillaceae bacterium]|nr:hypothetical protein [Oceanospirillaceae bacterium]